MSSRNPLDLINNPFFWIAMFIIIALWAIVLGLIGSYLAIRYVIWPFFKWFTPRFILVLMIIWKAIDVVATKIERRIYKAVGIKKA